MELSEVLGKAGLKEKEARVYLALLELGTASVEAISRKAGTKRPTTYLILDDLQSRGMVGVVPQAQKTLYTAESPETLLAETNRKQELLKRFLPNLLALHNARKEKPQVQLFQGIEGVKRIYQQIYEANEVYFFGTIKEVARIYPEGLQEFVKRAKTQGLKIRDLLTRSQADLDYAGRVEKGANYEIRFIRENMDFPSDTALFGDRVVFFSFHPQIFAVVIKSREITQSLKTLYELAWQKGEALQKIEK